MQRPGSASGGRATLWSRFNSVGRVLAAVVFLHLVAVLALTAHSRAQGGPIVLLPVLYMLRGDHASKTGRLASADMLQQNATALQRDEGCGEQCDGTEEERFTAAVKDSEDLVEAIREVEGNPHQVNNQSDKEDLSDYQRAKLAKQDPAIAASNGRRDGIANPIRLPTLPKTPPPPPSSPPPTLLDADAAQVAEADRQEQKLHLLEQLRDRRKEVERLMAQRRAEREGISYEEAAAKQAGKENVEKAVLAMEKPQENVKKAFHGGQNGRVQPAPSGFLATLFRKDERPKEDKSWLDRMSDAILDKLELRWEDDEEARMQDDEDGTSQPQMSSALQLDDKVADPDMQKPAPKKIFRMWPTDECANALQIPKVAMMYLTKGALHHEETWRLWFEYAAGKIPLTAAKGKCDKASLDQAARACAVRTTKAPNEVLSNQHLFNVYIHVGLNNDDFDGYPNNSLWHNRDILERVQVEWGKHSLVTATRNLLQVALQEPLNKKFILLSESGIPLYPPTTLYHQLMTEEKSRLNACTLPGWERHPHRWSDKMESPTFRREHWRKSSQWFALNREHAELVMGDTVINQAFHDHCYPTTEDGWWRDCFSDEHVFATLLAVMGRENETDCKGFMMHVDWSRGGAHPRTYEQREISAARLRLLRMPTENCGYPSAIKTSAAQFVEPGELQLDVCSKEVTEYSRTLGPQCPLLARKFPPDTAAAITTLISECKNRLKIVHGNDCHHRLAMLKKYL